MQRRLRLHLNKDFQRVKQLGEMKRHPDMMISYMPNAKEHNRYGIITNKRLGNAVKRNRTRRLIREAIRQQHPTMKQGYDIIFIARPPIVGQPLSHFQRIIHNLSRRATLLD